MPCRKMIHKAGKFSFLLVCLFLSTACQEQKAVFEAGEGQPVVIQEETKETTEAAEQIPDTTLININTADMTELMMLPGIGEVRAAAIIEHRQTYGDFEKIEDIMNVKGIKNGIFSKINSLICVK